MEGSHCSALTGRAWLTSPLTSGEELAELMKDIQRVKLSRRVYEDPSLASRLEATKATAVYNTRGVLIQAVSTSLGSA